MMRPTTARLANFAAAVVLVAASRADAASEYQCGPGKPNADTKRCDCPNGKVENTDNKGVSRCVDPPPRAKPPTCPAGMEFKPGKGCVPVVVVSCPPGTTWTPGEGCVAKVVGPRTPPTTLTAPPPSAAPLSPGDTIEFTAESTAVDWSGEADFKRAAGGTTSRLSFFPGYKPNGKPGVVDKIIHGYFTTTAYPSLYAPVSAVRVVRSSAPSLRAGVRVMAVRPFERIRIGMKGTYWGTNGGTPPAFVLWDEVIGATGATYYRDEGAPDGRADHVYWVPFDVITVAAPPQECGQSSGAANYGPISVGTTLILGRHRAVGTDDNWAAEMSPYVGRRANVTQLVGVDKSGCPVVKVDADGGAYYWRIRDAAIP